MNSCMPWDITAAGTDGGKAALAARPRPGRHLIAVMLLTAAALDLTRCGLVLAAARHLVLTVGLVAAGLAAAVLTVRTAYGCQPTLGMLGRIADRRRFGPAGGRIRFSRPVHHPRHRHRCRWSSAGRDRPSYRRCGRAAGSIHPEPVHHRRGATW